MKLEVGMYVIVDTYGRYGIGQIKDIVPGARDEQIEIQFKYSYCSICRKDITKASHNIIDLIKNKDLCEIEFYSLRYNERVTRLFEVEIITDTYINFKNARCEFILINKQWNSEDLELKPIIKKVLTHEQFENNCYKIGDN